MLSYKNFKTKKNQVTLIEKDKDLCNQISERVDIDIINGDGSDLNILKDAEIDLADVVAAVTGKDEENLVICQVAKNNFNVQHTIARVNNPKNQELFQMLGVDNTVCSTQVITNLIDWECESDQIKIIQIFEKGQIVLVEVEISKNMSWCNKYVKNLNLLNNIILASVFRKGQVIYPKGNTLIQEKDKVVLVTDSINLETSNKDKYSLLEKIIFN